MSILDEQPLPDLEQAKLLLAAAVAERGEDYVDPNGSPGSPGGCRYVESTSDGLKPACIVGHVLHAAGWNVGALRILDQDGFGFDLFTRLDGHSYGAGLFLQAAQTAQDYGQPWGRAMAEANNAIKGPLNLIPVDGA